MTVVFVVMLLVAGALQWKRKLSWNHTNKMRYLWEKERLLAFTLFLGLLIRAVVTIGPLNVLYRFQGKMTLNKLQSAGGKSLSSFFQPHCSLFYSLTFWRVEAKNINFPPINPICGIPFDTIFFAFSARSNVRPAEELDKLSIAHPCKLNAQKNVKWKVPAANTMMNCQGLGESRWHGNYR